MNIQIAHLNKAEVLAALFNNAKPQGFGVMEYQDRNMPVSEAEQRLKESSYFDYLEGRVMKVDLSGDSFSPSLYDRDNGTGAAEKALKAAGLIK